MVVKMMKWRPWPPLVTRKYEVRVVVKRLEGFDPLRDSAEKGKGDHKLTVEIKWKGPKMALSSLRRTALKRNYTREVDGLDPNGVSWDEEFQSLCNLSAYKENVFHPWEIAFTVFNGLNRGTKNRAYVVGTASLNVSDHVSSASQEDLELNITLTTPSNGSSEPRPLLCMHLSLSFLELRTAQETSSILQRLVVLVPSPPHSGESISTEKDELSALKAGLRKVKILTEFVSTRRAKKASSEEEGSEGRCSARSEDGEYNYPLDSSDSLDDVEEGETDESKEDSRVRKSFSYGTLAYANYAGGSFYTNKSWFNDEREDWVYYTSQRSDVGSAQFEHSNASVSEPSGTKRGLLSWRKRKLHFRSPKNGKGEPLLKKAYGEEGGDDIDYDRRLLSSDESPSRNKAEEESSSVHHSSVSEFGDDCFAIGRWDLKEVISRDGQMKLQTEIFFASIDQRSEQAAGESACTALVAVIADWFQNNRGLMPIKSQFDSLIRDGSLEWRNLCENETYRERFPDKHFDLETVLQAKIHPLSVLPGKSFIGFFHPEEGTEEGKFEFLHGAMSFDSIWEEISLIGLEHNSNDVPLVYIVSWNDHFFILKVEPEAYYIVDTLGERLYEGCNQAYILKFDRDTTIIRTGNDNMSQSSDEKTPNDEVDEEPVKGGEDEVVYRGKESCKEYIKNFLAAIPIRELQADIKRGLFGSTPLHHRLQIEFHYTRGLELLNSKVAEEKNIDELLTNHVALEEIVVA